MNQIWGLANVAKDAEIKFVGQNGTPLLKLYVVFANPRKTASGAWEDDPCFIEVTVWGQTAQRLEQQGVGKGTQLLIRGRLKMDNWEDKQSGQRRTKHTLVADQVRILKGGSQPEQADIEPEFEAHF